MPFSVIFHDQRNLLESSVRGVLSAPDVAEWEAALVRATAELAPTAEFRVLDDWVDYEVADQDLRVHKLMREVTPRFLASHGFAVGFWRLYDATPPAPSRVGRCTHVAHVHHDADKMSRYNELLASPHERFFTDREAARRWLGAT